MRHPIRKQEDQTLPCLRSDLHPAAAWSMNQAICLFVLGSLFLLSTHSHRWQLSYLWFPFFIFSGTSWTIVISGPYHFNALWCFMWIQAVLLILKPLKMKCPLQNNFCWVHTLFSTAVYTLQYFAYIGSVHVLVYFRFFIFFLHGNCSPLLLHTNRNRAGLVFVTPPYKVVFSSLTI